MKRLLLLWSLADFVCIGQTIEGYVKGADDVRLFYRKVGKGRPTTMLLHGGPGSSISAAWPDLEPISKGRAILMYDQRGGGRSELIKDPKLLTAHHHVRDLEVVRSHFKLERMNLIGESWGAGLAALYTAEHSAPVARLLLLGPMPPTKALSRQRFQLVDQGTGFIQRMADLRRTLPTAPDPLALCRDFYRAYIPRYFANPAALQRRKGDQCNVPAEGFRNWLLVSDATLQSLGDWDFMPSLTQLHVPALIVEGEASDANLASARAWAAAMPDSGLLLIPKSGHFPQVEQPEIFFPAIEMFLKGAWPPNAVRTAQHQERR